MEWLNKISKWIKEYLSWIIAVGGLAVSIYGITKNSQFTNNIVFLIIIIDSLILLGLGVYIAITYFKNMGIRDEYQKNDWLQKSSIESLKIETEKNKKAFLILEENNNYIIGTLQKFLSRLYNLTDKVFEETDVIEREETDMRKHGYSHDEIEEKVVYLAKEKNKRFSGVMYDDYNRFLSIVLKRTQENIEAYLMTKGYDCEVAVTLKQFLEPCDLSEPENFIAKPYVYTAFRDPRTWGKKIRKEVAEKLYTVKENSDFLLCLSQGHYIFNNKNAQSKDYCNENKNFDKFYNCGVTKLVLSTGEERSKTGYGFLACDTLNTKYENEEIMDEVVSRILGTSAYVIAAYFDNIDFNWYLCQVSVEFDSFWNMVYKNYLVEI